MELLQDLVLVAAVLVLFEGLVDGVEDAWWFWFAGVLIAVYLLWLAEVMATNGFPGTGLRRQVVTMLWMVGLVIAATGAMWQNWQPEWVLCAGAALVFGATAMHYLLVAAAQGWRLPALTWAAGFLATGSVLCIVAAASSSDIQAVLLPVGIALGAITPPLLMSRCLLSGGLLREHHLSERFGQLVLIMLGESFLEIVIGVRHGEELRPALVVFAALVVFLLWRAYFLLLLPRGSPRTSGAFATWIIGHAVVILGFGFAAAAAGRWATAQDMGFDTLGWASTGVFSLSVAIAYVGIAVVAISVRLTRVAMVYALGAVAIMAVFVGLTAIEVGDPMSAIPLGIAMILINLVATRWAVRSSTPADVGPAS